MAPFARVVTSDPQRKDGVRVNRLTEFPAEDVFLESEIAPQPDTTYVVPTTAGGAGCIGLEWLETRRLTRVGIEFAGSTRPAPGDVRVEAWVKKDPFVLDGHSPCQGKWVPIQGALHVDGSTYTLPIEGAGNRDVAQGTYKVRWLFPATDAHARTPTDGPHNVALARDAIGARGSCRAQQVPWRWRYITANL